MDPGLNHVVVVVVCFVPSCGPDSASSAHAHGFDEVRMHPHDHLLHWKLFDQLIYISVSVIQSEVCLGLSHVIVLAVCFVLSCKPDLAISAHTHGYDEVRMHPHGHPLHWKVLNHFKHI